MNQSVIAGIPPNVVEIIRGRFDPQTADKVLMDCSDCPSPNLDEYRDVQFYSWGEDYSTDHRRRFTPPAFDELGRGSRIAVLDSYVLRAFATPDMESLIDANSNKVDSLADVDEFRSLVDSMSRLGAYSMLLSDEVDHWKLDEYEYAYEVRNMGPWLHPYEAYAVGIGRDDSGNYATLALFHTDDDSAEENVERLRRIIEEESSVIGGRPWSEIIDVDRSEVNADGRILLAKLRDRYQGRVLVNVIHGWDSLIVYETMNDW